MRELAAWGVPWSRVRKGDRDVIINGQKVTITERDEAHGLVAQRDFGGTKKWRTCYVSDGTGHAMLHAMSDQAIGAEIPVHERTEAIALIHDAGRCYGAIVRNLITGELVAYVAKATAITTGGAGRIYRVDDQRRDLRRHRAAGSRWRRASRRSATWRRSSSIRPASSRPASSSPKAAAATAACSRTSTATASCRTTSRRRRSSPRATS